MSEEKPASVGDETKKADNKRDEKIPYKVKAGAFLTTAAGSINQIFDNYVHWAMGI